MSILLKCLLLIVYVMVGAVFADVVEEQSGLGAPSRFAGKCALVVLVLAWPVLLFGRCLYKFFRVVL